MASLDGLDTKTAELQQRAKTLLEKRFDWLQSVYFNHWHLDLFVKNMLLFFDIFDIFSMDMS